MVGSTQGGHPPLQATTSHPVPSAAASRPPEDGRGASLGRNVQPPASATAGAAIFPPRPPSHVSEEMSDVDTDTEGSPVSPPSVERASSVKLTPGPGLLPPPPPNPRLSPWKEMSRAKGHARSVSHGGVTFTRTGSNRERERPGRDAEHGGTLPGPGGQQPGAGQEAGQFKVPLQPLPSALKRPGHRRVFSECATINPDQTVIPGHMKAGRAQSKTDFILPHDHVDRERRSSEAGAGLGGGRGSGHKRGHSRGDSIGQYFRDNFRGHSRQASRTDSIYTLRQTTPNVMNKIRFWQKAEDAPPVERKCRKVVPNHLVPADTKVKWPTTQNCLIVLL